MPIGMNAHPRLLSPTAALVGAREGRLALIDVREDRERRDVPAAATRWIALSQVPQRIDELPRMCRSRSSSRPAGARRSRRGWPGERACRLAPWPAG